MAVAEWVVLMHKYPELTREEVDGKTEADVRELCRRKRILERPEFKKLREFCESVIQEARNINKFMNR